MTEASRSWIPVPAGSGFPLENLPFGVFEPPGGRPRVGVAIGDGVLDLSRLAGAGLLDGTLDDPVAAFSCESLNGFLKLGAGAWRATRARLHQLLRDENGEIRERAGLSDDVLLAQSEVRMVLPIEVGDYADFFSSIEHATNAGRILRPGGEPLFPNYRHLPVGYYGRSSTVVVSGTDVRRPCGQGKGAQHLQPVFGPSTELDYELEIGFITGPGPGGGEIATSEAGEYIFGFVLLNDWSARDLQAWEAQPLGPSISKSFATSISPWVVPLDALAPYRVPNRLQDPAPLEHLRVVEDWAFDVDLEVAIETERIRAAGTRPALVGRVNFRDMYWNAAQQLAHLSANGARIGAGDLYGSGTVSGTQAGSHGSLLEATEGGRRRLRLPGGEERSFLEDGDAVIMRGVADRSGQPRIGFGEVSGRVIPAAR